jgi:hypothetical protein
MQSERKMLYDAADKNTAVLWVLNMSDCAHSLPDIAGRTKLPFSIMLSTAQLLLKHGLLCDRAQRNPLSQRPEVPNTILQEAGVRHW